MQALHGCSLGTGATRKDVFLDRTCIYYLYYLIIVSFAFDVKSFEKAVQPLLFQSSRMHKNRILHSWS